MQYRIIMSDTTTDTRVERILSAKSVFDAIDKMAEELDHPEAVELVEAEPILED